MFWTTKKESSRSSPIAASKTPLAISLEPRMLFDGAVAATVAETTAAPSADSPSGHDANVTPDNLAAAPSSATSDQRQEVVFIDASVKDKQQLLDSLVAGTEFVILDADRDGLAQMAEYLDGRSGIDAIHFISHGGEASLQIGSTRLGLDNIANAQSKLAAIGSSLTESGDFLIYGCDTSKGEQGAAFVTQLANFTGADIAASDDWTGNSSKGGDWVLESSTGAIEAETLFADASYNGVLNTLNAGDMVVLGWNSFNDTLTFATLVDIPAGTVIKITDKGWDQSTNAFTTASTADGVITWTTSSNIDAGALFTLFIGGSDGAETLTNVTNNVDLSADISVTGFTTTDPWGIAGDGIFIYQDADNNPYFIFGMNNSSGTVDASNWNTSVGVTLRDSMLPNGAGSQNALTNGANAIGLPGGASQQDNVQYIGPTSAADRATWLARITNLANWSGDSTGTTVTSVGTSSGSEVNIAPPNSAPVIGNLNGDSTTFTEGGSAVWLDAGSNATVTDADSANFDGGNVTVAITANGTAGEDVLAIRNEGTGAGQISVSGSTVSYGGTAIGTITSAGMGGANLVVTLNASANAAAVQALIRNLTYANGNDAAPSTAARTVSITVNDGDGGTSTAAQVTVNVIGVNDAPTITATGNNPTYTENGSAVDLFNSVSINTIETGQSITGMTLSVTNLADGSDELLLVDGTSIALLNGNSGTTASNGISYSVSVFSGTATITLSSAGGISATTAQTVVDGMAYRNSSDAPSTATRVITLTSITDNGGTANGGVDTTATSISTSVSVVAVNDAPIVTSSGGASTFTEGGSGTVIDPGLTLSDPDNATLLRATVSINGNFQPGDVLSFSNDGSSMGNITAEYDSGTGVLMLTSSGATATLAQWQAALRSVTYSNGSDTPSTANRTIGFVASDGQNISATATRIVSVTAVNDAPEIDAPASIAVTEDVPSAITGISFSDVDAGSSDVTVTLTIGSGSLSAIGTGSVTVGGTASALTLTGSITNINSYIAAGNLRFTTAANATADVTLMVNINDGGNSGDGGAQSANETITLQVTAVNDAPTIVAPGTIVVTEDVPGALTGISFADVDAGSSNVTVTFSVPSGTLSATSAGSVTVSGTASALTLNGSLADINAFIAASGVSFTTASNATANVTLTVSIDDGGNTGSGGAQTDTTNVTLTVTAVNDAPVNSVPTAQSVDQDANLVFNSGNGNLISISDVDAGSNMVEVTLSATNGLLSLSDITGLSFSTGDGTGDASMTFTGSLSAINNALDGLVFTPTGGYNGPASITIVTNDQGWSGSGGAQTDTDTVSITVNSLNPRITDVSAGTADGIYKVGDTITITATFSEAVTVDTTGGIPTLLLETGSVDRLATYISGSGGNTLTFSYVVQAGDLSVDLDYQSTAALNLNGSTIRGATANDAILTLAAPGAAGSLGANKALVVDGVRPTATSITLSDTALRIGETATVTITFAERVVGLDTADFTVAGGMLTGLSSADGGLTWTATFTPDSNLSDATNVITLDNTGVMDLAGNIGSGSTDSVNYAIDTQRPTASIVVTDTALRAGQSTTVTITFSEAVVGLTTADFIVANATLSNLTTSDNITWTATLTPGANVTDATNLITLDNFGYTDIAGNPGGAPTDSNNYAIDTQRPTAISVLVTDTTLKAGQSTTVTITFSETVTGLDTGDFSVANGTLSNLSSSDGGLTWTATLTPDADVTDATNLITLDNTGYTDAAGNTGTGTTDSNNYALDTLAPTVTSVSVPTNGTYVAGQDLDFTVNFDDTVTVDTTGGTPRLAITLDTGTVYANYLSGSGTNALVFRLTVTSGQEDSNGIAIGTLQANGGSLRDASGNNATATLNNVDATTGVLVDSAAPTVVSVTVPPAGAYAAGSVLTFTVNLSEGVTVDTSGGTPRLLLDLGGHSVHADYVSGSGSSILVFSYTVQAGDTDSDGITVSALTSNGSTLQDAAGNAMDLNLVGIGNTGGVLIDTTAPVATGITRIDASPTGASSVSYTVTFSESVSGVDASDFSLLFTGSASGSIASVTTLNGQIYVVVVNGITGNGTLGLNLRNGGTGIADNAGNTLGGGLTGPAYAIDRTLPAVSSVSVPANGTYIAGQNLDFTVNFSESVIVDVSGGTPRIAVTLDTGGIAYANYVAGSGSSALTFRLTIAAGQFDGNGIDIGGSIQLNGATLRGSSGNDVATTLAGVGGTAGVRVDAQDPTAAIALTGTSPTSTNTLEFRVTFDENVSGVDIGDFGLLTGGTVKGTLQSVVQLDARTYQVVVTGVSGNGSLQLALNAPGSGIVDAVGNHLGGSVVSSGYEIQQAKPEPEPRPQPEGDPEFRVDPPVSLPDLSTPLSQLAVPSAQTPSFTSPLLPPPLFEALTPGGGLPPLGNIFINRNALAPSYIAQVFASSDSGSGNGNGIGFLGFGGGDGGVFGTSSFSSMFSKEVPLESGEIQLRWGGSPSNAVGGGETLGAPTLGQQLHEIGESEQRQIRDLAWAFGQISLQAPNA
ncbi:DUF4347 domain-containing protein [Pseudomonas sp. o96-267]|nr:DUF4347 domain-containing protein [Pseudomonas sp. o96-267]